MYFVLLNKAENQYFFFFSCVNQSLNPSFFCPLSNCPILIFFSLFFARKQIVLIVIMGSFEKLFLIPVPFDAPFTISLSIVIVRPLPWYENWLQLYLDKKTLTLAQLIPVFYTNNMYMILLRGACNRANETDELCESYRLHLMRSFGKGWGEQADRLSPLPNSADLGEVCRYHREI